MIMGKKVVTGCLFVVMMLSTAGLAIAEDMPAPDSAALWDHISKVSPYTAWSFWPDHQGLQEGNAPHAPQHKIFVNSIGLKAEKASLDFGAIVVKENIGNDDKLKALTVMYKVRDYNPEAGNWFWAKYSPSGKVAKSGKVKGCIECHTSMAENDYLFMHEFVE
jgi:hypothetical protein